MNLAQSIKPHLAEVKSNPRLRWGLWLIAATLWFYGVLVLRDEVPRQTEAWRAITKKLARTELVAVQTEWPARRDEALTAQVEYENRLWRATTAGLAQASFTDWLNQLAQEAGVGKLLLSAASQEEESGGVAGLWKVSARLSFDFTPSTFYPLLSRIATYPKKVGIESLVIRGSPSPRAELMVVAYFQRPAAQAAAPKAGTAR